MTNSPQPKERPILFSAPMVRAILDGRKNVTRRPVKGGQIPVEDPSVAAGERHRWMAIAQRDPRYGFGVFGATEAECAKELEEFAPCPYGRPGDRLWVRETWYCDHDEVMRGPYLKPDDLDIGEAREDGTLVYAADGLTPYEADQPVWKPSIHMPRWACRILLEITDVRVERLQDISEGQAVDEGLVWEGVKDGQTYWNHADHRYPPGTHQQFSVSGTDAVSAFRNLWKSTGGDWDSNPWVWVVEFKRAQP
ncbi:hypothetical protein M5G27_26025 [Pseudomonas shahriarae]|uniref:Morphogenetic protein n=1 Tax=Pseudomonas shahriarae TaxID=2745512 RepID=A0A9X4HCE1_9PSED|nr:hypothetical protein [Pseudomonas shahriarae]MDD1010935.1 hypothetical protein [Pseudomonas shahriarae]